MREIATLAVIAAAAILAFSYALPPWMATAAIAFLGLAFVARGLYSRHLLGHTPADWPLAALLLLLPVSVWASPDRAVTYPRAEALVASAALFWVMADQRDRPWLRHSGWLLLAGGLALAVAVFVATPFPSKLPGVQVDLGALQARLRIPFLDADEFNPNLTGHVMALLLAPAVALVLRGNSRAQRLTALLTSGLLVALLALSQSRGAWLAIAVAIPVITVAINWRWLWVWGGVGLAGLAAVAITGPQLEFAALNLGSGGVNTLQDRLELWSRALYLMHDFPFTGVGLGMPEPVVKLVYPTYLTSPISQWHHVHNTFLQVGSEMGIPGLIAFTALLLTVGAVLVRQVRRAEAGAFQGLAVGLLGSWTVFVVHSLVDAPLFSPRVSIPFFVLLGLMVAVGARRPRRTHSAVNAAPPPA